MSTNLLLQLAESGQYKDLFRKLGWGKPAGVTQLHLNAADQDFNLNQVAQPRSCGLGSKRSPGQACAAYPRPTASQTLYRTTLNLPR